MNSRLRNLIILLGVLAVLVTGLVVTVMLLDEPVADKSDSSAVTNPEQTNKNDDPEVIVDKTYVGGNDDVVIENGEVVSGTVTKNEVVSISVSNEFGDFTIAKRDVDNVLAATSYFGMPRDAAMINALCEQVLRMEALTVVETEEEDAAYGMDDPTAVVTATYSDGSVESFTFGIIAAGTKGYYCRHAALSDTTTDDTDATTAADDAIDNPMYIVDTAIVEQFLIEEKDLVGKALIAPPSPNEGDNLASAQLLSLELSGACREVPVKIFTDLNNEHEDLALMSTYLIEKPYLRSIDSDVFSLQAMTMLSLTATGVECVYPTEEDLARYGLAENPHSIANITLAAVHTETGDDGVTRMNAYNERQHVVILGDKDEDGNYYALVNYELEDGTKGVYNAVYLLSPTSVPWAEQTYFDLVDKKLHLKNITTAESLTVAIDGTEYAFSLTHHPEQESRDNQLTVTYNGTVYPTADFRVLYQLLIGIHRSAEKEAGFVHGDTPKYEIKMTFNDGTEDFVFSLYEMSSSRYLLVTHDGEEIAVSISDADEFIKQIKRYVVGETVQTPY